MPLFFQQDIDADTRLAIWKIEEEESFFSDYVPLQRAITHPHKRLQHLAGRYLLMYLFPDFPLNLILIADTKKPFLEDEAYHFSISHCGDFAAAIVSKNKRVGVDIEIPTQKTERIQHKFLHERELRMLEQWNFGSEKQHLENKDVDINSPYRLTTLIWSAKEAMFKWWGYGNIDFSEMLHVSDNNVAASGELKGLFINPDFQTEFPVYYKLFPQLVLAYIYTAPSPK